MKIRTRYEIDTAPGPRMREAYLAGMAIFAEEFGPHDVTSLQFAVLCHVRQRSGLDQVSLAEITSTDRTTTAKVVSRLEKRGLLRRKRGSEDRRTKRLYLTPAGVAMLGRLIPLADKVMARFFEPLKPQERAAFSEMLARLIRRKGATPET